MTKKSSARRLQIAQAHKNHLVMTRGERKRLAKRLHNERVKLQQLEGRG
jgi:hypothetical protein